MMWVTPRGLCLEGHNTHLLLGDLHGVPENRPEHSGVARRCGQGPLVAIILFRPLRKQLFNAETWNVHFLAWRDMLGDGVVLARQGRGAAERVTEPRNVN